MPSRTQRASRRAGRQAEHGQVLVVFAISIVGLLAATALAFDIGRFYSERRFLQNAADAGALAAASALVRGESTANAILDARNVLARNFLTGPNGIVPPMPPATGSEVYEPGHAGDPRYLADGILVSGSDVRVAVRNSVPYTFGRVVGFDSNAIGAQARAGLNGQVLPIAVRRHVYAPGPNVGATAPCPDNQTQYLDFFSTANTACLGTETDPSLRAEPSAGAAFDPVTPESDPTSHGPVVVILGQGAQPQNGADFRGFIALDIRNFSSAVSQAYYNGVTPGTNSNTLKSMQANWISTGGYPGPAFPPATMPPDPADQVATMSGNSTGIAIDAVTSRFAPGDEVLVAVYPGIVHAIPDFTLAAPASISLPPTGTVANAGTLKLGRNNSFSGQVTLSTLADDADPANPMVLGTLLGGATPIAYNPNPATPSLGSGTNVQLQNVTTSSAAPGIYALWIQAQAGSPFLTTKVEPVTLTVGTIVRDFTITSDSQALEATTPGASVTFNLTLKNAPTANTNFGGPVSLSIDGPLPAGIGSVTLGSGTVTPNKNGNSTSLTINTGTMASGRYRFTVRARGMNGDPTPRSVTHLLPLEVDVPPVVAGNNPVYVDIVGFAVMRITALDTNAVWAYAISPVIPDPNDPRLRRGQAARLVPWN